MNTMKTSMYGWKDLPWKKIERQVFKLQKRIYQVSLRGETNKVHKLQRLLLSSWSAKCLAVRRVSQDNRGKKTAGIDGVKSLTQVQRLRLVASMDIKQKAHPIRRVWIPKPGKQEKRPLGIPTMKDRALQMLVKLALEPEWEAKFEPNSYGFRPGRSTHDAIEAIYQSIHLKPQYVLDADIEKCFDRINHQALLKKLNTFSSLRRLVKGWLKAGIMDNQALYPNKRGTPQGGVCSPLLANIALCGLETTLKESFPKKKRENGKCVNWQPKIVVYADDFIIMHHDSQALIKAKEIAALWLAEMGLKFNDNKTRITHTLNEHNGNLGFDFLGFNVRQYESCRRLGFKTNIKPSKDAIKRHLESVRDRFRWNQCSTQEELINVLNPVIRGWANYYSTVVSSKIFHKLEHFMWEKLMRWIRKKHPKTGCKKTTKKYFHEGWNFRTVQGKCLQKYSKIKIKRHIKVRGSKSPLDGDFIYWATRRGRSSMLPPIRAKLLKKQSGKCTYCGTYFRQGDVLEVDHIIPLQYGGMKIYLNLQLLHGHCHDSKSALDRLCFERC